MDAEIDIVLKTLLKARIMAQYTAYCPCAVKQNNIPASHVPTE